EVDTVVLCTARISDDQLYRELKSDPARLAQEGIEAVYVIGDASAPRMIVDSIFDGHRLAREIDSPHPEMPLPFIRERRLWGDSTGAGDSEVVVITVGDEEAEEALLGCLARGADRALRVWDDSLEGADPLAVARVLASAVQRESPDLVLCGVQSSDAVNGATG